MIDPEIPATMTCAMQRIQKFVSSAYYWYVAGIVPADRIVALVEKLDDKFDLESTDGRRQHDRRRGRCTFRLVLFPSPGKTDLSFWLLRTDGSHPLLSTERWRDARSDHIQWPFLYELRQIPVSPSLRERYARSDGKYRINPVTWTWRFRRDEMDRIRANVRHWTQHQDERLPQLIRGLARSPGFRAIRADVFALYRHIATQCERRNRPIPDFPAQPWVRGRRYRTFPLSLIVSRVGRGETWFPSSSISTDTVIEQSLLEKPHAAPKTPKNHPEKNCRDA